MDRVVNFLNASQHKVLFVLHDTTTKRVRFLFVISRRCSNVFLIEIGHGGIDMGASPDAAPDPKDDTSWSVLTAAETYRYGFQSIPLDVVGQEKSAYLQTATFLHHRLPSWGWDLQNPASIVVLMHPYMIVTGSTGSSSHQAYRLDDFEWSLRSDGCFLMVRLEDFHTIQHTIHDRIEAILLAKASFVTNAVHDFLKKTLTHWQIPGHHHLCERFEDEMADLISVRASLVKTAKQLIDLYRLLHDVSLESIHMEDRLASVDQMVFHQVLTIGQQKRKLHRSLDQLRLLEKHVLEFYVSLHFRFDHVYLSLLNTMLQIQTHLMDCENIVRGFTSTSKKNDQLQEKFPSVG